MSYAKKTCNICGYRDEQPNMYRVEKDVYVGSGNTGLSGRTWLGAAIGYKKSQRQIGRYFLAPSKRNYTRRREVWMCGDCAGKTSISNPYDVAAWITGVLIICGMIWVWSKLTGTIFSENIVGFISGIFNFIGFCFGFIMAIFELIL